MIDMNSLMNDLQVYSEAQTSLTILRCSIIDGILDLRSEVPSRPLVDLPTWICYRRSVPPPSPRVITNVDQFPVSIFVSLERITVVCKELPV